MSGYKRTITVPPPNATLQAFFDSLFDLPCKENIELLIDEIPELSENAYALFNYIAQILESEEKINIVNAKNYRSDVIDLGFAKIHKDCIEKIKDIAVISDTDKRYDEYRNLCRNCSIRRRSGTRETLGAPDNAWECVIFSLN